MNNKAKKRKNGRNETVPVQQGLVGAINYPAVYNYGQIMDTNKQLVTSLETSSQKSATPSISCEISEIIKLHPQNVCEKILVDFQEANSKSSNKLDVNLDLSSCEACPRCEQLNFHHTNTSFTQHYVEFLFSTDFFQRLQLRCGKCGMAFFKSSILAIHMCEGACHRGSTKAVFICSVCKKVFGYDDKSVALETENGKDVPQMKHMYDVSNHLNMHKVEERAFKPSFLLNLESRSTYYLCAVCCMHLPKISDWCLHVREHEHLVYADRLMMKENNIADQQSGSENEQHTSDIDGKLIKTSHQFTLEPDQQAISKPDIVEHHEPLGHGKDKQAHALLMANMDEKTLPMSAPGTPDQYNPKILPCNQLPASYSYGTKEAFELVSDEKEKAITQAQAVAPVHLYKPAHSNGSTPTATDHWNDTNMYNQSKEMDVRHNTENSLSKRYVPSYTATCKSMEAASVMPPQQSTGYTDPAYVMGLVNRGLSLPGMITTDHLSGILQHQSVASYSTASNTTSQNRGQILPLSTELIPSEMKNDLIQTNTSTAQILPHQMYSRSGISEPVSTVPIKMYRPNEKTTDVHQIAEALPDAMPVNYSIDSTHQLTSTNNTLRNPGQCSPQMPVKTKCSCASNNYNNNYTCMCGADSSCATTRSVADMFTVTSSKPDQFSEKVDPKTDQWAAPKNALSGDHLNRGYDPNVLNLASMYSLAYNRNRNGTTMQPLRNDGRGVERENEVNPLDNSFVNFVLGNFTQNLLPHN